jgi:citrate synthase
LSAKSDLTEFLDQQRGIVRSSTGGWFPGKGVFSHGYSMMDELVGEKSYFQVLILNATGKMVDKAIADWVEAIYICLSWPDPRIWCNQIGALGGTVQTSVVAATVAGTLASDSRTYGVRPLIDGVEFIQGAMLQQHKGFCVSSIVESECAKHGGKPYIVGYARPIAKGDERLEAMERVSESLGFSEGEHLRLAYAIEEELRDRFDEGMNINGYMSAFLSDQGFSAQEVYQMFALLVMSGVTACYLDTLNRPSGAFLPQRCSDIDYQGKAPRVVPDPE